MILKKVFGNFNNGAANQFNVHRTSDFTVCLSSTHQQQKYQ